MTKNILITCFIALSTLVMSSCSTSLNQAFSSQQQLSSEPPKHIALLLPLQGANAASGQSVRDGFLSAYYDSLSKTGLKQTISFYDTNQSANMSELYQKAVNEGADFVVGPLLKNNVEDLTRSGSFSVPTLELNYTEVWIGSLGNNLYQFGLSPLDESKQMAEKAASEKLSRAIIIAPQNDWGNRNLKMLVSSWQSQGGSVVETYRFNSQSNFNQDIARLLHINAEADHDRTRKNNNKTALEQQRRQDFDVVFLLADAQSARSIVPMLKFYYVTNVPIYATSSIKSDTSSPQSGQDLSGVIYCDIPYRGNRLFAVGQDAYLLSRELPRLTSQPGTPIYGSTGALTLSSTHQIYRKLSWTQMQNGSL